MENSDQPTSEDQRAILKHLQYLVKQIQAQEETQRSLLREMRRTRRSVATVWFAELISPILALVLVAALGYYGIKIAEQQYLGGMDVFGKIHESMKEYGAKLSQYQNQDDSQPEKPQIDTQRSSE